MLGKIVVQTHRHVHRHVCIVVQRPRVGSGACEYGCSTPTPRLRLTVKILTVVGNRPQFIKAAAVSGPLRERHEEILVHTGQHYDDSLSRIFFTELGLQRPERELALGGGSNTSQTARML